MSAPNYGQKVQGVAYPVFEQVLGAIFDERYYGIDIREWLKGRTLKSYTLTSVDIGGLKVETVSELDGVVSFKAKEGQIGYQTVKLIIDSEDTSITRHYCIKVRDL
ncbi:hypothetical protein [Cognaticolwellia mytili]|uniref:hypothetical protein n=1 Tax=Cognaticolwellia mytili TaxID=1888913 RepID=UPI000A174641|nr:hypothetical protein [Cognaticolwellia mytili]